MESIFHLPARPLSPRPPAPHISFSPESCWALRMHRFRLPPSSRQVGRTRPASGQAAPHRLSRRIRAKEGALRCESNTHPCHPCNPRTVPLSNPNILELPYEIRTAPRTLPRWLITSPRDLCTGAGPWGVDPDFSDESFSSIINSIPLVETGAGAGGLGGLLPLRCEQLRSPSSTASFRGQAATRPAPHACRSGSHSLKRGLSLLCAPGGGHDHLLGDPSSSSPPSGHRPLGPSRGSMGVPVEGWEGGRGSRWHHRRRNRARSRHRGCQGGCRAHGGVSRGVCGPRWGLCSALSLHASLVPRC